MTALRTLAAVGVVLGACLASCASPAASPPPTGPPPGAPTGLAAATGAQRLAGVCPNPVVVQESWEPEAEHGVLYQLLGPGTSIDAEHKRLRGPLVADDGDGHTVDTGVSIELRAGGAAIGFTATPAQMYLDRSITLGAVHPDLAIGASAHQPVTAVVAPLNKSPLILMWDPASHPTWRTIADIGASGAPVVVSKADNLAPWLVGRGLVKPGQVDLGYTGSPARFVADPTIAQEGYVTMEPYVYEHEVPGWRRPVAFQMLADVGYQLYPEALSVRSGELGSLAPCLRRLVPIIQRAQADYLAHPGPANHLIVRVVAAYHDGWSYSIGVADYAAAAMRRLGIVANDTTGPLGGMDPARVQSAIHTLAPLLTGSGAAVRPGLTASDIATDQFVDPSITLPR